MSLGVPVLTTPNGGMVQLVEDGESGWVSQGAGAADLHAALARALEASEAELGALGRAAADTVRKRCDPEHSVGEGSSRPGPAVPSSPRRC
jgi:glycosyltransferase involved in cell wall biosynthesis